MKKVPLYKAETEQRIAALPTATPDMIREYLRSCYELAADFPPQNIVKFPFTISDANNPYRKMRHWLEQIDFQPLDTSISQHDIQILSQLADQPASDLRQNVDSTEVKFDNPFLCRFSQTYIVSLLLSHLHVYNFLLENYIHESQRLREWIQADLDTAKWRVFHRLSCKRCPAQNEYQYWVRDFLCHEAVNHGSTPYSVYMDHCFGRKYRHRHPVILPDQRQALVEAYEANRNLAKRVRHYAYYCWLQPSKDETRFMKELHSEKHSRQDILFSLGPQKLEHLVTLAGSIDRQITHLVHHHNPATDNHQL